MKIALYVIAAVIIVLIIGYICFYKQINVFIVAVTGKNRIQKRISKACKAEDLLIINDMLFQIEEASCKRIDTIIFGNKYIYICKISSDIGELHVNVEDPKWRLINGDKLILLDNPLQKNNKTIQHILNIVHDIEAKDIKNVAVFSKACTFERVNYNDRAFVLNETELVKFIIEYEKNSNDDIIDPYELNRFAKSFYNYGLKAEKKFKAKKGKKK